MKAWMFSFDGTNLEPLIFATAGTAFRPTWEWHRIRLRIPEVDWHLSFNEPHTGILSMRSCTRATSWTKRERERERKRESLEKVNCVAHESKELQRRQLVKGLEEDSQRRWWLEAYSFFCGTLVHLWWLYLVGWRPNGKSFAMTGVRTWWWSWLRRLSKHCFFAADLRHLIIVNLVLPLEQQNALWHNGCLFIAESMRLKSNIYYCWYLLIHSGKLLSWIVKICQDCQDCQELRCRVWLIR